LFILAADPRAPVQGLCGSAVSVAGDEVAASRRGLSLLESLIATTVLGIVVAAATLPFAAGLQQVQSGVRLEQAVLLGASLMDEIIAHPFEDPSKPGEFPLGPTAGQFERGQYQCVGNYHGYADPGQQARSLVNNVIATTGTAAGIWRSVTVEYVTMPGQAASDAYGFALVTVRVFDGDREVFRLARLVAREY
jgi:prepilin-type N-terminal cleavage/methylation domain-containing protein